MHILGVNNYNISLKGQNNKKSSIEPNYIVNSQNVNTVPLDVSKAYAAPQINCGYKELQTFEVPYVGQGKLYELTNGHKIILIPKKVGPTTINTSIKVGNFNEPANLKQISHLLEHLVDNNCTDAKDEEVKDIINKTGADYNASTGDYATRYHVGFIVYDNNDLENLLKVQSKTLLNKNFTDEEIQTEKKIIIQELDSRDLLNSNDVIAENISIKNLFNLKDNDDALILPSESSIKNITKEDLINYYNKFYQPNNMVTTIVGSVDENTIKLVAKYLGDKSFANTQVDINYPEISTANLINKTVRKDLISKDKDTKNASVHLSLIGPNNDNEYDNLKLNVVKRIFINRAINKIKESKEDNKELFLVSSQDISNVKGFPTVIEFYVCPKNYDCEESLKKLYSDIYDIANNPVSTKELEDVKKEMTLGISENKDYAQYMAINYSERVIINQGLDDNKYIKSINLLTEKDIQETAKKYFDLNKASLVVIHPYKTPFDKVKKINEVSFKGNADPLGSKEIHEYVLPNNLRVVLDSRLGITKTVVSFNLHSKKKIYTNPQAASVLEKFILPKNIEDIKKDGIDTIFDGNSQRIFATVSGDPNKTMEIINCAVNGLLKPNLSESKFEKYKKNRIKDDETNDGETSIITEILDEMFIESPYYGSYGDLQGLEYQDVVGLHQQILKNAQGTIFITLPKEKLKNYQDEIFKTLKDIPELKPYSYKAIFDKVHFIPFDKTKVFVHGNENSQIEVRQNFKIIESGNIKDRAGLALLNQMLGYSDRSLLFQKLREQDKIAYSANSIYVVEPNTGKVSNLALETRVKASTENLHKVLDEYKVCLDELKSKPISKIELNKFKTKIKSDLISSLESSDYKNGMLRSGYNTFYGASYLDEFFKAVDEMTPEYLQALAKHYFSQPYLLSVDGNKEVIDANKEYLSKIGEFTNIE